MAGHLGWRQVSDLLRGLGHYRDGILVAASAVYGVGYLTYSLYAFAYNLGFLPALQSQYLMAGVVPTILLLVFLQFGRWLHGVYLARPGTPEWSKSARTWFVLRLAAIALLIAISLSLVTRGRLVSADRAFTLFVFLFWTLPFVGRRPNPTERFGSLLDRALVPLVLIAVAELAIVIYIMGFYRSLPIELGGLKPRFAVLDVVKADLSEYTKSGLQWFAVLGRSLMLFQKACVRFCS
ncbi:MAG: hypothetical protein HY567_01865 [Candidatus Kerfeldbacteria bacterium]|nr:hypothetical protein [Candidatus Kerfeldbacteria bacterium]